MKLYFGDPLLKTNIFRGTNDLGDECNRRVRHGLLRSSYRICREYQYYLALPALSFNLRCRVKSFNRHCCEILLSLTFPALANVFPRNYSRLNQWEMTISLWVFYSRGQQPNNFGNHWCKCAGSDPSFLMFLLFLLFWCFLIRLQSFKPKITVSPTFTVSLCFDFNYFPCPLSIITVISW